MNTWTRRSLTKAGISLISGLIVMLGAPKSASGAAFRSGIETDGLPLPAQDVSPGGFGDEADFGDGGDGGSSGYYGPCYADGCHF